MDCFSFMNMIKIENEYVINFRQILLGIKFRVRSNLEDVLLDMFQKRGVVKLLRLSGLGGESYEQEPLIIFKSQIIRIYELNTLSNPMHAPDHFKPTNPQNQSQIILIGSYSQSILKPSIYKLSPKIQSLSKIQTEFINPSFIYYNKSHARTLLYAVQETQDGCLVVFDLKKQEVLQRVRTFGNDPCHITMNERKNLLVVTNYSSGSFVVFKINEEGLVEEGEQLFVLHEGSGPNLNRQASPHPHSSMFIPKTQSQQNDKIDEVLLIADLGTDCINYYIIRQNFTKIKSHPEKSIKIPGSGPRHMAKGPEDIKVIFVCGQLDSSVSVLRYANEKLQILYQVQISTNFSNYPSEIIFCPKESKVYVGCRGDNEIKIFNYVQIEENNKFKMSLTASASFKVGQWPRHFNISEQGIIYVACQYQNCIQSYKFVGDNKLVKFPEQKVACPSCICFQK